MGERINISSGAPWEPIAGYSRAVRVGQFIEVAGTTAVDAQGNFFGEGDVAAQTQYVLEKIQRAIEQAGVPCLMSSVLGFMLPIGST